MATITCRDTETGPSLIRSIRWRRASQAGLIVGLIVFLLSRGIPWIGSGAIDPAIMGREVAPGHEPTALMFLEVFGIHMAISLIYAWIVAAIAHGFRPLIAGTVGGVVGLVLYFISAAIAGIISETAASQREWPALVSHIAFGIIVAEAYKGLAKRRPAAPVL
jgi:hypothetical protein